MWATEHEILQCCGASGRVTVASPGQARTPPEKTLVAALWNGQTQSEFTGNNIPAQATRSQALHTALKQMQLRRGTPDLGEIQTSQEAGSCLRDTL